MRIVSRAEASVISVTSTTTFTSASRCGKLISMLRGRSMTVISNAWRNSSSSCTKAEPSVISGELIGASAERIARLSFARIMARSMNSPSMRLGIVDRVGQAAARLEVERQRAGAEVHVEIEQRGRQLVLGAEQPRERSRQRRGADAAARADDRGRDVALARLAVAALGRGEHRLRLVQRIAHLAGRERLEQVVVNAAREQVAIEAHVVDLADRDHDRAGLADFGQRVDVVERIAAFRQVDHQDAGLAAIDSDWTALRRPPLAHFSGCPAHFDDDRTQHVERGIVADEGGERIAVAGEDRVSKARSCLVTSFAASEIVGRPPRAGRLLPRDRSAMALFELMTIGLAGAGRAVEQVLGIGDHRREVAVDGAAEAGAASRCVVVRSSWSYQSGQPGTEALAAGDDHAALPGST